ncbi:U-box domain-containing protein 42 [Musa troglodytarum]|uniref:U-box domain-containing protein 42 n=1 Tax=Musa troglodytarum TaxID=320322 RepID=A0A9E7JSZ3_9LILI|nr:U-box domain-containing protein 42 [Musa troglodytarum]
MGHHSLYGLSINCCKPATGSLLGSTNNLSSADLLFSSSPWNISIQQVQLHGMASLVEQVKDQKVVVVESLLAAISEIMSSVASVEIEHQTFMELGCYLHRISPVIMEFQTIENGSPSAFQILQSLSAKVKLANNLVVKCSTGAKSIRDDDLKFITEELEEVIRKLGQDLSTIPLSTFQNKKYAEIAVQSLSREMKNVCFHINGTGNCITEERKLENSSVEQLVKRKDADLVPSSDEKNKLHSTWSGYMPRLGDFLEGIDSDAWKYARGSIETLSQIAEYSEPLYDTFFCPITKRIMDDPVTIESGITFERKAIAEWFGRFKMFQRQSLVQQQVLNCKAEF